MTELLPWERLLWSGRPWRLVSRVAGERYLLTDFRLVRIARAGIDEIPLDDVGEIQRTETALDRLRGTSTIVGILYSPKFVVATFPSLIITCSMRA